MSRAGTRTGYAYGTDLSEPGLAELADSAVGAARVADEDENSAAPDPSGEPAEIKGSSAVSETRDHQEPHAADECRFGARQ
jgi:predicted Zn-dependent protease